jgi:hypothetical protein
VFGDEAVRRLAAQAKERLNGRVEAVLRGQAARYTAQLDALGTQDTGADGVREAAHRVAEAARAERSARAVPDEGATRPWSGGLLRGAGTLRPPQVLGGPQDAPESEEGAPARRGGWWSRWRSRDRHEEGDR